MFSTFSLRPALADTLATLRWRWPVLLGASLLCDVIMRCLPVAFLGLFAGTAGGRWNVPVVIASDLVWALSGSLAFGVLVLLSIGARDGRPIRLSEAISQTLPILAGLIVIGVMAAPGAFVSRYMWMFASDLIPSGLDANLVWLITVGITELIDLVIALWLAVASLVMVVEGAGIGQAIRRSTDLMRRHRRPMFAMMAALSVLIIGMEFAISDQIRAIPLYGHLDALGAITSLVMTPLHVALTVFWSCLYLRLVDDLDGTGERSAADVFS